MKTHPHTTRLAVALLGSLALLTVACSDDESTSDTTTAAVETTAAAAETTAAAADTTVPATDAAPSFEGDLVGTFSIDAGTCDGTAVSGSYFQMVQPGGNATDGPFIPNADSACADTNYSLLAPGTDGGLITGDFQAAPEPAFDATGNGLAAGIVAPVTFFAVAFAAATDPTGTTPSVTATAGALTADLSAFTAYYGAGTFNQGAPKPDGTGTAPTGTIDPATGVYMLEWTSLIVGGSFDGFTGVWHLEGTFTPAA